MTIEENVDVIAELQSIMAQNSARAVDATVTEGTNSQLSSIDASAIRTNSVPIGVDTATIADVASLVSVPLSALSTDSIAVAIGNSELTTAEASEDPEEYEENAEDAEYDEEGDYEDMDDYEEDDDEEFYNVKAVTSFKYSTTDTALVVETSDHTRFHLDLDGVALENLASMFCAPAIPNSKPVAAPRLTPNILHHNAEDRTLRFQGAPWFEKASTQGATVVGLGGIGSFVVQALCRIMGTLTIWDGDRIEDVNMAGQCYRKEDVGKYKAHVMHSFIYAISECLCLTRRQFFNSESTCERLTITGLDSMSARKMVYRRWKELYQSDSNAWFIDGRLSARDIQVFAINGGDTEEAFHRRCVYEKDWLFDDSQADATVCSFKQTSYLAQMIGSIITNVVVNIINNQCNEIPYVVPFLTTYNAELMMFEKRM